MQYPLAYLNGEYLPFPDLKIPVYDLGIVQGATITERLRTFRHQPYCVSEHLQRLQNSLMAVNWSSSQLSSLYLVIEHLLQHNTQLIDLESDLSVVVFITAGLAIGDANGLAHTSTPTVCAYTAPLPLSTWRHGYQHGIHLITSHIQQLSPATISPHIKMRSRLHWQLADAQVKELDPQAMAILLDDRGFLTETSSGNLFLVREHQLYTPRAESTLPGISQQIVEQLAADLEIPVHRADLTPQDLMVADEAFLTSSTYCMMPVTRFNQQQVGDGVPGKLTRHIAEQWSRNIGFDFMQQANRNCSTSD